MVCKAPHAHLTFCQGGHVPLTPPLRCSTRARLCPPPPSDSGPVRHCHQTRTPSVASRPPDHPHPEETPVLGSASSLGGRGIHGNLPPQTPYTAWATHSPPPQLDAPSQPWPHLSWPGVTDTEPRGAHLPGEAEGRQSKSPTTPWAGRLAGPTGTPGEGDMGPRGRGSSCPPGSTGPTKELALGARGRSSLCPGAGGAMDVSPLPLSKLQGGIHFSLLNSLSRRSQSAGIRSALWPHESPLGFLWVMHCVPAVLPWDPRRLRGLFARPGGWDAHTQRSQASEGTRAIDTRPPARPHLTDVERPRSP